MSKTFLDSVHGGIKISRDICENIIDTPFFQRLRRIEQNSCRAVYPSARHDRFIHSLGVYHLGCRIVEHIKKSEDCSKPADWDKIAETYKMACLLHDIGHTPFSHTFEEFFDSEAIISEIRDQFPNEVFALDSDIPTDQYTPHELLSAWLAIQVFSPILGQMGIDKELMVRMIIGLRYKDEDKLPTADDFRNIMIELIHGTIDADGLDYVCRDVWAGGYNSFNVNLQRLIDSIKIEDRDGKYILSFSSKALNEIETVLNVKNFQFLYVINHHKVLLEQYYLIEGVKSAASFHCNCEDRDKALRLLCNYRAFVEPISLEKSYNLYRPCDDDFICLMKQTKDPDKYIEQWFSRTHSFKPLWKTRIEFFHIFKQIIDEVKETLPKDVTSDVRANACEMVSNSVNEKCRNVIAGKLGIDEDKIICKEIKPKFRQFDPKKIRINLNGDYVDYTSLKHEGFKIEGINANFYFWYVDSDVFEALNQEIINEIQKYLENILINGSSE